MHLLCSGSPSCSPGPAQLWHTTCGHQARQHHAERYKVREEDSSKLKHTKHKEYKTTRKNGLLPVHLHLRTNFYRLLTEILSCSYQPLSLNEIFCVNFYLQSCSQQERARRSDLPLLLNEIFYVSFYLYSTSYGACTHKCP